MARLPADVIERIKYEVSLVRLAQNQGYQPKKQGKDYALCCPFHDDKTPSLIISPNSNLFNCFGCGVAGSVIDWVMKTERRPFREAVEWLRNDCLPLDIPPQSTKNTEPESTPTPLSLAADAADDQALLQRVILFYHDALKQSPEAQAYLKSRGLDDPELIETFKLGYANRTLGLTLPDKTRKAGSEIRSQLQRVGLYRESGHEHFAGSIVIPVMDEHGQVKEVYARKIGNRLRKGTAYHLYLPGPHEGVFNVQALHHSKEIILCESLIDALTFWRYGFKHVTTSYGTNGFTDELLVAFKQHRVERVLIAYDRDEAGNNGADRAATQLMSAGIDCFRIQLPKGMDVNEWAKNATPPEKSLGLVICKAQWMGKGQAPTISTGLDDITSSLAACSPKLDVIPEVNQCEKETLPEPPSASPLPVHQPLNVEIETTDNEIMIPLGDRRYRVRGLHKATSYEVLKVNLLVSNEAGMHVDSFDLYSARHRQSFIKQASLELGVEENALKKDLGKVLLTLEKVQQQQIDEVKASKDTVVTLNDEEQREALALLQSPHLLDRILEDFNRAGVVGEEANKLVGYLAAVSRKLDNPLAVLIQSTSAAGKSSLMNAVLSMMPEEERIQYSAMTGQSLFYMGETHLKHKILAIAEEEGAENASYALKLLQSEGELTIASTGKDADGNLTTQEYRVEGPVMLFSTTTAIDIDEELLNRCVVLTVNESREQTRLIHTLQRERETLNGLLAKEDKKRILTLHRNAQRLLKSVSVVNPYAPQLTFMDNQTRSRRDHMKYLQLIKTITLLHQYQRETKTVQHGDQLLEYIEVTPSDIETANRLACDVLGRSLDELPPQTRKLLRLIKQMVDEQCQQLNMRQTDYRFSRRTIRDYSGWSDNQLKVHCHRLEELEYLLVHGGSRGKSLSYELLFADDISSDQLQLMGLITTDRLQTQGYDDKKLGQKDKRLGSSCPQVGAKLAPGWTHEKEENTLYTVSSADSSESNEKRSTLEKNTLSSYRTPISSLAAATTEVEG
jgi:DNA primase